MSRTQYNWSRKSLDELVTFYNERIAPEMIKSQLQPQQTPPRYEWLTEHGFSGLAYTLREHHGLTLSEFFVDIVGVGDSKTNVDSYDWTVDNQETVDTFETYLRSLQTRGELAERTIQSRRSRLAQYARTYEKLHGAADLQSSLTDIERKPEEINRCLEVFDVFNAELSTDGTKLKYLGVVSQFYDYLVDFKQAKYNPVERLNKQFNWTRTEPDNKTVDRQGMSHIYTEADDTVSQVLVLALGAWGLRPNEVASLHVSQFVLDDDGDERIEFEERKNGPGSVAVLFGVETVRTRIAELDGSDWEGYLFPSSQSSTGHITGATVNNRFKRLAADAGVVVNGETPTAKMGRRFWYSIYKDATSTLVAQLEGVAADQGSASPEVVVSNYLSEKDRRGYRREAMADELTAVFGNRK
jgi:integrase